MGVLFLGVPYYIEDLKGDPSLENYPSEALGSAESGRVPNEDFPKLCCLVANCLLEQACEHMRAPGGKKDRPFHTSVTVFGLFFVEGGRL